MSSPFLAFSPSSDEKVARRELKGVGECGDGNLKDGEGARGMADGKKRNTSLASFASSLTPLHSKSDHYSCVYS